MQEYPIRPVPQETALSDLLSFLCCPLYDAGEVFARFRSLPDAQYHEGENPMERFVYVPGRRIDRVLLIAHADTVWDENYTGTRQTTTPVYDEEKQTVTGSDPDVGIGADDRAGCALLWLLKDSGHSLLVLDGEEHGLTGCAFLRRNEGLLREINRHRYLIELDFSFHDQCHYHKMPNTRAFCDYIETNLHVMENTVKSGTDLPHLAKQACGVNLSIGCYDKHRPSETLHVSTWYEMYGRLCALLSKPQPRFRVPLRIRAGVLLYQLKTRLFR